MTTVDPLPTSTPWPCAARLDDLRGDGPHAASAGGVDLVVVRTGDGLRAFEGRCPHQGALLGEGELEGSELVCRNHRWRFQVSDGARVGGPERIRRCPAREEKGSLLVDVSALAKSARDKAPAGSPKRSTSEARASGLRSIDDLPGPRALPLFGNALQMNPEELHLIYERWAAEHGPIFQTRLGPRRLIGIADGTLMEPIRGARPETFRRYGTVEPMFAELGIAGVFSAEGAAWRPQRKLAMEALSHRNLRGFFPTLSLVTTRLLRRWQGAAGRELDLADELKRFTVDVTTSLAFGLDMNTLEQGDDVIQRKLELFFPVLNRRLNSIVPYWRYVKLPTDRRLDRAVDELRTWLAGLTAEARKRLAADPERALRPANFLEAMIAARDEEGRPFSEEVIFGNSMTMLLAGEDTTAYTLAWAIDHLCDAPAAAAALRGEADRVLYDASVPADIGAADGLAYANAVANEAMRLRSVAPLVFLEANEDVVVGDVLVPKGVGLALMTRLPAMEAKNFGAPEAFRPERWIESKAEGCPHHAAASTPFGSGPRICPGRSLAMLEMRVVLAALYKAFDFERVGSATDVRERFSFTMTPVGLNVRALPRSAG